MGVLPVCQRMKELYFVVNILFCFETNTSPKIAAHLLIAYFGLVFLWRKQTWTFKYINLFSRIRHLVLVTACLLLTNYPLLIASSLYIQRRPPYNWMESKEVCESAYWPIRVLCGLFFNSHSLTLKSHSLLNSEHWSSVIFWTRRCLWTCWLFLYLLKLFLASVFQLNICRHCDLSVSPHMYYVVELVAWMGGSWGFRGTKASALFVWVRVPFSNGKSKPFSLICWLYVSSSWNRRHVINDANLAKTFCFTWYSRGGCRSFSSWAQFLSTHHIRGISESKLL